MKTTKLSSELPLKVRKWIDNLSPEGKANLLNELKEIEEKNKIKKNKKLIDGRVKIAPELKTKIIKFCTDHPSEKQLTADANGITLRTIQIWMKALKASKPVDLEKQQKAIKKMKEKYPTYFN